MSLSLLTYVTGDCKNQQLGALTVIPIGGITFSEDEPPLYIVQWPEPLTNDVAVTASTRTGLSAGTYVITVFDSSTPVPQQGSFILTVSSGVCVSSSSIDTNCSQSNGSFTISANTASLTRYFYLNSFNNGLIVSAETQNEVYTFESLSADTYFVTVVDEGGCSGTTASCIVQNSSNMDFGLFKVNNSNCGLGNTGAIYVTGETGQRPFTYLWSPGGQTTRSITGLSSGSYSVRVSDSGGCEKNLSINVENVPQLQVVGMIPSVQPTCFQSNGELRVIVAGGSGIYYYLLSTGQAALTYDSEVTFTGLSSGPYSVSVYDGGFCTATGNATLSSVNSFDVVSLQPNPSSCNENNGSITINVQNGLKPYEFKITNSQGITTIVSDESNTFSFTGLKSDTYKVSISNPSTCFYESDVVVTNENRFTLDVNQQDCTCGFDNGKIIVNIETNRNSTYTYFINNSSFGPTVNKTHTFNNLSSGVYNIRVVDNTGCEQTKQVVLKNTPQVKFTLITKGCGLGNEGEITALVTEGEPRFVFDWSDNVGNQGGYYVKNLSGGNYTLRVTDINGCTATQSTSIDCPQRYFSYEDYNICDGIFTETRFRKYGFSEMLNQGFKDLTLGDLNCKLRQAKFILKVTVDDVQYTSDLFTTTSLLTFPSEDDYIEELENLLEKIPGVGAIVVEKDQNKIKINSICDSPLEGKVLKTEIIIQYDVCCEDLPVCLDVFYSDNSLTSLTRFVSGGTINEIPYWLGRVGDCVVEISYNLTTKRWETNGFKSICTDKTESYSYFSLFDFWANDDNYIFYVSRPPKCCNDPILPGFLDNNVKPEFIVPIFDEIPEECAGTPFSFPSTSNNGIVGTWTPALDFNNSKLYVFTPNPGQNAREITLFVVRVEC